MIKDYCISISVLLGTLSFSSCASDENISSEALSVILSENIYLDFNKWIYSKMNHDYLWREDMPDSLSCNYDLAPVAFYNAILSPKDRFSYCETNDSYEPKYEELNLGYEYQRYKLNNGFNFSQVLLVTNPELKKKGLKRGDIVIPQDNKNIIVRGKLTDKTIQSVDTLESTPFNDNTQTVYIDSIYIDNNLKIGYLCYLQFDEITDLVPTLRKFYDAKIDELILDLRYNPGGYVSTSKYLSNSIVNEIGYNGIFQQCSYNDILTKEMEIETGCGIGINYFTTPDNGYNVIGSPMFGLNLKRIFVLTSKNTASASEAAIISLRPYMDVVIIGEQTYGKGVGSWTIRDSRYKYQLQPITMRYHNALMETTPDDGLAVDYYIPDGFSTSKKELGDTSEPLLAKALELILGKDKTYKNQTKSAKIKDDYSSFVKKNGQSSFVRINMASY